MTFLDRERVYISGGGGRHPAGVSLTRLQRVRERHDSRGDLQADKQQAQRGSHGRHTPRIHNRQREHPGPKRQLVGHAAVVRVEIERLAVQRPVVGHQERALHPQQKAEGQQHRRRDACQPFGEQAGDGAQYQQQGSTTSTMAPIAQGQTISVKGTTNSSGFAV